MSNNVNATATEICDTARDEADIVIVLTLAEARDLPNMLGVIIPFKLDANGYATAVIDGVKTFYELIE